MENEQNETLHFLRINQNITPPTNFLYKNTNCDYIKNSF